MRLFTASLLIALAACDGEAPPPAPPPPPAATPEAAPPPPPPPAATPAPDAAAAAAGPGDAKAGEAVYTQYCAACHQTDGSGMNGMLAANFKDDPARLARSDEELLKSIREGFKGKVGQMPPWGSTLTEQQMRDVLAYVRDRFGAKPK